MKVTELSPKIWEVTDDIERSCRVWERVKHKQHYENCTKEQAVAQFKADVKIMQANEKIADLIKELCNVIHEINMVNLVKINEKMKGKDNENA